MFDFDVAQLIRNKSPLLLGGNEAAVTQATQVVGGVRLGEACRFDDFADAQGSMTQDLQYGEPGWVRESSKQLRLEMIGLVIGIQHCSRVDAIDVVSLCTDIMIFCQVRQT